MPGIRISRKTRSKLWVFEGSLDELLNHEVVVDYGD
jgi:hypothetical protein